MFDQEKLVAVIAAYKDYFPNHWKDEKYKWEAIQYFQEHWNISAENFLDMFMEATDKTYNLLAREINIDDSLGPGFRIGHSYFCGQEECTEEWMKAVVYYDIIPMLQEYWFDDRQKVKRWENLLIGVFND